MDGNTAKIVCRKGTDPKTLLAKIDELEFSGTLIPEASAEPEKKEKK